MSANPLCSYAHVHVSDGEVTPFSCALPAELPLIDLMKLYEGAFLPSSQWPQPQPGGEETSEEEGVSHACRGSAFKQRLAEQGPDSGHPWVW